MGTRKKLRGKTLVQLLLAVTIVASLAGVQPAHTFATAPIQLSPPIPSEPSTVPAGVKTHDVYRSYTVTVNNTGGFWTLSTTPDGTGSTVADDAADITVIHPDNSRWQREIVWLTHDKPPIDLTAALAPGVNTVVFSLVDLLGPVRGSPRPFYLVNTATRARLRIEAIPFGTAFNPPYLFGLTSRDPVNTAFGVFTTCNNALVTYGLGPTPRFTLCYASNDTVAGPVGVGWSSNLFIRLVDPDDNSGDVVLVGEQGRRDRFVHQPDGSYTSPPGVLSTLTKNDDESYTVAMKDRTVWDFASDGSIVQVTDKFGYSLVFIYNTERQLVRVIDPLQRGAMTLSYDAATGLLASVSDWLTPARTIRLSYTEGRLTAITNADNATTHYSYDPVTHALATIINADGQTVVSNAFDSQGRVISQKDGQGITTGEQTEFEYVTNADGTHTTTVRYPHTTAFPSWRNEEVDTYDAQYRIISRLYKPAPDPSEWFTERFTYRPDSLLDTYTDGRNQTTRTCYDVSVAGSPVSGSRGNITRVILPPFGAGDLPRLMLRDFDSYNNVVREIPPRGVNADSSVNCSSDLTAAVDTRFAVETTYDTQTHTVPVQTTRRFTDPELGVLTAITKFEYTDPFLPGVQTRVIPPQGNVQSTPDYAYATTITYSHSGSTAGMPVRVAGADGAVVTHTWDAVGRPASTVDAEGNAPGANPSEHTWSQTWDNEDRPRVAIAPPPTPGATPIRTETIYSPAGFPIISIDGTGQVTKRSFDSRGLQLETRESAQRWTDPATEPSNLIVTRYEYGPLTDLKRVIRAAGDPNYESVIDYASDGLLRMRTEHQYPTWPSTASPLVTTRTYYPTTNEQLRTLTDPLGRTTTWNLNSEGLPTYIAYSDGLTPNVSITYTKDGLRQSMRDGTGLTTYVTDESGKLVSIKMPGLKGDNTVGYRYNLDSALRKLIYPGGDAVTYYLDAADRVEHMTDWSGMSTYFTYFPSGAVKSILYPNNTKAEFSLDNDLRLREVWNRLGAGTISRHTCTQRDGSGNCLRLDEILPVQGVVRTASSDRAATTTFNYNGLSWETDESGPAGTYRWTYTPTGDRKTETVNGATVTATYDRAGRIQTYGSTPFTVNAAGNTVAIGRDTLAFDQANRAIETRSRGITHNQYNGDGIRVATDANQGNFSTLVYDMAAPVPLLLDDSRRRYVYAPGPGNGLLYDVEGNGTVEFHHFDLQHTVRATTYRNGNTVANYLYNSFGVEVNRQGTSNLPLGYTSEWMDKEDNYIYLSSRFMYPAIGRFITRDSFPGSMLDASSLNRYTYGRNNGRNFADPSGRIIWIPAILGIGAVAGAVSNTIHYYHDPNSTVTPGGVIDAVWKGAAAGAVGAGAGLLAEAAGPIAAGAASGATYQLTLNALNHDPLGQDVLQQAAAGAILGPIAKGLLPDVGRPATTSWRYGLGSPWGGYWGLNTLRAYGREALEGLFDIAAESSGGFWRWPQSYFGSPYRYQVMPSK